MTRDNLETRNMVPILWNDITSAHIERRRVGKHGIHDFICFEVRDLSVYKLKWWQKIQKKSGKTPFAVDLDLMPKKERELFEQTIRARIEIADKRPQK